MRVRARPKHSQFVMNLEERIAELERSNHELRAVLILAGKEMRKHGYGRKDTPLLRLMRRTLREARAVVRKPLADGLAVSDCHQL